MGITTANIKTGHQEAGRPWQIIFKTLDGRDYGRGTLPAERTEDEVHRWTMTQCAIHGLACAVIERW